MHIYTAYIIGSDGHISCRLDLYCLDDEAAKEFAQQLVDDHAVELWDGVRKIATFEPVH
jgi:hypothetical protein